MTDNAFKYSFWLPTFHSQRFDYTRGVFHLLQKERNKLPPSTPPTSKPLPVLPVGSRSHPVTHTSTGTHTNTNQYPHWDDQWESYRVWNSKATVSPLFYLSARPLNLWGPSRNFTHCSLLSSSIVGIHSARAQWVSGQSGLCCN